MPNYNIEMNRLKLKYASADPAVKLAVTETLNLFGNCLKDLGTLIETKYQKALQAALTPKPINNEQFLKQQIQIAEDRNYPASTQAVLRQRLKDITK